MKTIGLLGGMSWESTEHYYRAINEGVRASMGGLHSAQIAMVSVDFAPMERLQSADDWESAGTILVRAAGQVMAAGAEAIMICSNTMHKVAAQIERAIPVPLLHVADATAEVLIDANHQKVGLLGTAFTMEQDFYKGRLANNFGLEVLVPNRDDRKIVHDVIYQELCLGKIQSGSRDAYLRIIEQLAVDGAEAVILGCTEIGMLVSKTDTDVPLVDTTKIHAARAVDFLLRQAGA